MDVFIFLKKYLNLARLDGKRIQYLLLFVFLNSLINDTIDCSEILYLINFNKRINYALWTAIHYSRFFY